MSPSSLASVDRDDAGLNVDDTDSHVIDLPTISTGSPVAASGSDEASRLKDLATEVRDQDDLERDVHRQADQLLTEQAIGRDEKRSEKTQLERDRLQGQIVRLRQRHARVTGGATSSRLGNEISHLEAQVRRLDSDIQEIKKRIEQRVEDEQGDTQYSADGQGNRKLPGESQREFLIRTGKITPFSKLHERAPGRSDSSLQGVLLEAEEEGPSDAEQEKEIPTSATHERSHRNLLQPGFDESETDSDRHVSIDPHKSRKRRKTLGHPEISGLLDVPKPSGVLSHTIGDHPVGYESDQTDGSAYIAESGADDEPDRHDYSNHQSDSSGSSAMPTTEGKRRRSRTSKIQKEDLTGLDDGNERLYQTRLEKWAQRRRKARVRAAEDARSVQGAVEPAIKQEEQEGIIDGDSVDEEGYLQHPTKEDTTLEGGYKVPGDVYPSLFDYQKTGVQWLCELHTQQVGGIVGDEMGLGKTIQIIAFLAGLHYSRRLTKPVIVIAPATVMKQWVNEFHTWWPPLRVSILHTSGSGMFDVGREAREEDDLLSLLPSAMHDKARPKSYRKAQAIVERVVRDGHVLVTTYSGLQSYAELLVPIDWEYAVLDEGHKIRNPNTAITIYCKELRTSNRIILSGTPMQNNLVELWSLFDFIFPMRLGTLVNFRQQFEMPIRQGGYANASNLQVQTAMKCAETLKDTISPYLLQRFKSDVASDLPKKSEQVLFCKLTKIQRDAYEGFLKSEELKSIMAGKRQILYGVDILRKICNHPDLVEHRTLSIKPGYNYGSSAKSGKMQVVKALLDLWKEQGHKTLLFAQHRIMLDILERTIRSMDGINHRRMDGTTTISMRQGLVDEFNDNPDLHVFLLTTKVGGLGINLTGANRVIIYDPDWNPSTDVQARERAWRLGQKREVLIYRLMTAGTIEEKIYHRQLFKQFLINKILRDPKQRRTFQLKDLHDLFTLGDADEASTETASLFKGNEVQFGNDTALSKAPLLRANSISELAGVAHTADLQDDETEQSKAVGSDEINSDSRMMESIFVRSGVQSALEHDQIVNGKKVLRADPEIIEREAKRVAAEAAKQLKKAGEAARNVPLGTPTWTGQFGIAGRPDEPQRGFGRGRGGPSSAMILAGLQNRQAGSNNGIASRSSTPGSTASNPPGIDFVTMIRNFLRAHGGSAYSQMMVQQFTRQCNTPSKTAGFKAMLKEIAVLEKGAGGRGKWVLKAEYR